MSIQEVRQSTEQKMVKTFETLRSGLAKVRTGRAHTGLLEGIMVDYYGNPTPLSQVANLTLMDARTIGV
ncbi:MAG: ribosome recycling factor, partial [Pseudomonadota bacterium]